MNISTSLEAEFEKFCKKCEDELRAEEPASKSTEVEEMLHRIQESARADPLSDGDQSIITDVKQENMLCTAWNSGLDMISFLDSPNPLDNFHLLCYFGIADKVAYFLTKEKQKGPDNLRKILESRATKMRFSPLHFACCGAKNLTEFSPLVQHDKVVLLLCQHGARVESKDIAGNTPLMIASNLGSNKYSLPLVRILVKAGADPNPRNRTDHPVLFQPLVQSNHEAFETLLEVGSDLDAEGRLAFTPRQFVNQVPEFMRTLTKVYQRKMYERIACSNCSKMNATKHCGACIVRRYCSRSCQKEDWKKQHKKECGSKPSEGEYIDIELGKDTTDEIAKGLEVGNVSFSNVLNDTRSTTMMKAEVYDKSFIVKVTIPSDDKVKDCAIKINQENSDYLLIGKNDNESSAFCCVRRLFDGNIFSLEKIYLAARWVGSERDGESSGVGVLRLYSCMLLPPPSCIW